jgi:transcriptional regulator with XRE-family HTH domain
LTSSIFLDIAKKILIFSTMSPEQCRAARAWLDWTQQELARRAGVGLSTVSDFEKGVRTPIQQNLLAIRRAIEEAGMRFLFGQGEKARGIVINDPDT